MALVLNPGPEMMVEADAATYYEGETVKEGSAANRIAKTTAKGDEVVGIVCQTRKDPRTNTAEAHAAGDKIRIFKLNSGATVDVKSITGQTYNPGAKIYQSATSGQVTATDGNDNRYIGHYPRNMATLTTSSAGQLVPCVLDVEQGRALTASG